MLKERAIIERSTKDFIINFIIALRYIRIETKFNRNEVNSIIDNIHYFTIENSILFNTVRELT